MFGALVPKNDSSAKAIAAPVEDKLETVNNAGENEVESAPTETVEEESTQEAATEEQGSEVEDNESESETEDEDAKAEDVKKPKKGFERRIERFNNRLSEKDKEIDYWRRAAMGGTQSEATQVVQNAPTGKPQFSEFNDIETYTEALTDWKVSRALDGLTQKQQTEHVVKGYTQRLEEFKKATPDFHDVMDEFVEDYGEKPVPEIVQVAMESAVGPQIAYYLAKNTSEVDRIAALPPHRRLLELGKIEDRLSNGNRKDPETKKVSKAPPPITSVKGNGKVNTKSVYDDELPYEEWVKVRTKAKVKLS